MARVTGTVKHTHQYYKEEDGLWHCSGIDGCTHFMPKNMPAPRGRMSVCWMCGSKFQLTPVNMERDKPYCDACSEKAVTIDDWIEQKLAKADQEKTERRRAELNSFLPKPVIVKRNIIADIITPDVPIDEVPIEAPVQDKDEIEDWNPE